MTVAELLSRISSPEIAEWKAFERAYGPLGRSYSDDRLADIHDALQVLIKLSADGFEPQATPRPHEVWDNKEGN